MLPVWRNLSSASYVLYIVMGSRRQYCQAQICGLNIVVHAEELPALLQSYERRGHFDEVLALLEAALSLERAHVSYYISPGWRVF